MSRLENYTLHLCATRQQLSAWKKIEKAVDKYEAGLLKARQLVKKVMEITDPLDEDLFEFCWVEEIVIEFIATETKCKAPLWRLQSEYKRNAYWGE